MKIIKYINLKFSEVLALAFVYFLLIINFFWFKDSPAAILSAFFGITYTFLAGKGNPICYLFGLSGSSFYVYLTFHNALWGNLILYAGYYIPMQILGFFKWRQHLKDGKNEIIKTFISFKDRIILSLITLFLTAAAIIFLYFLHDKNPVIDGITAIFSIVGMYLTVRRAIEQWVVWMVVNGLSVIMWLLIAQSGEKVYSTVIMWSVYFILAIYFYICWRQEIHRREIQPNCKDKDCEV